jgi:hypothetical protein
MARTAATIAALQSLSPAGRALWTALEAAEVDGSRPAHVYMVRVVGGGPVKIGVTGERLLERMDGLRTGSPVELQLLALLHAHRSVERWLHEHFAQVRVHGEWFLPVLPMLVLAQEIREKVWLSGVPDELFARAKARLLWRPEHRDAIERMR